MSYPHVTLPTGIPLPVDSSSLESSDDIPSFSWATLQKVFETLRADLDRLCTICDALSLDTIRTLEAKLAHTQYLAADYEARFQTSEEVSKTLRVDLKNARNRIEQLTQ